MLELRVDGVLSTGLVHSNRGLLRVGDVQGTVVNFWTWFNRLSLVVTGDGAKDTFTSFRQSVTLLYFHQPALHSRKYGQRWRDGYYS